MQKLTILWSTWSIGTQTIDIVRQFPTELEVYALAVNGNNIDLFVDQIKEFFPKKVVIFNKEKKSDLEQRLAWIDVQILTWMEGLIAISEDDNVDIIVNSVVWNIWVEPTRSALSKWKIVALANKETIVVAWQEMKALEKKYGGEIRPIDSEHSAIWQCLRAWKREEVKKIWLTCSGGPFKDATLRPKEKLETVTKEQALKHPTWTMGAKITIDSSTLANKWLEVIEAVYLFGLRPDQVEVVIHPQSIVHSAVEFNDGSIIAELGATDMRRAISYAIFGEQRHENNLKNLSLFDLNLTFSKPDRERFPCLALAEKAVRTSQKACEVFSNVNEEAVALFLKGEIGFYDIPRLISEKLENL